jgi:hypothetical protein
MHEQELIDFATSITNGVAKKKCFSFKWVTKNEKTIAP